MYEITNRFKRNRQCMKFHTFFIHCKMYIKKSSSKKNKGCNNEFQTFVFFFLNIVLYKVNKSYS
jgi:hypothetical protein